MRRNYEQEKTYFLVHGMREIRKGPLAEAVQVWNYDIGS